MKKEIGNLYKCKPHTHTQQARRKYSLQQHPLLPCWPPDHRGVLRLLPTILPTMQCHAAFSFRQTLAGCGDPNLHSPRVWFFSGSAFFDCCSFTLTFSLLRKSPPGFRPSPSVGRGSPIWYSGSSHHTVDEPPLMTVGSWQEEPRVPCLIYGAERAHCCSRVKAFLSGEQRCPD